MNRYRLTRRGENALAVAYTVVITAGFGLLMLSLAGLAGWIEGGCK